MGHRSLSRLKAMKILCSCLQGHNGKGQKLVLIYLPLLLLFSCYVVLDSLHPMDCSPPGFPVFESVMPSNHLILCCPLLFLPSIIPSIRVFSNESALCITWPKYWNISFSISPFNEYSGLISFGLISLQSKELSKIFPSTTIQKHHSSMLSLLYGPPYTSAYDYWKNHSFDYKDLCWLSDVSAF